MQDRHGHDGLGHRREVDAEERIAIRLESLELLLELGQPAGDELDVLEHRPAALGVHAIERLLGDGLLALAERDGDEAAGVLIHLDRLCIAEHTHLLGRVHTGREQEEDGHRRTRVLEGDGQVEVDRLTVGRSEDRDDPSAQRERDAVGPDGTHEEQLLEAAQTLPIRWQRLELGRRVLRPLLPTLPRGLEVGRQVAKLLVTQSERAACAPALVGQPRGHRILLGVVLGRLHHQVKLHHPELALGTADVDRELGREGETVALEEAGRDELEERVRHRLEKEAHARRDVGGVLGLLCLVERLVKDEVEGGERVLVHGPHDVQLVHQKVDERAARSVWAVELKRLGDLNLLLGGNDLLRVDLADGDLGLLERDDERLVGEDVALGGREEVKQVVAELLELDREAVLHLDELLGFLEQVGPLVPHDRA